MNIIVSPTGKGLRNDAAGGGYFGASRGAGRLHDGMDFLCEPGQVVVCPHPGTVIQFPSPYPDSEAYEGIEIRGEHVWTVMFYLKPHCQIGERVEIDDVVGIAQDISKKYGPPMLPHIHLRVIRIDPAVLL